MTCRIDPPLLGAWLTGVAILVLAALLRGAEYDEQYTLFLTGQQARPDWPATAFPPALAAAARAPPADVWRLLEDLRQTDVHPPLYFLLEAGWRALAGDGLVVARMPSVAAGATALWLVGRLASRAGPPAWLAVILTGGCYAFAYTGAIARGFALAQALNLAAAALLLARVGTARTLGAAGVLFGAASCANYLAVLAACGVVAGWIAATRPTPARVAAVLAGLSPFLAIDLIYFLAQRNSRPGQFPPFELWAAILRLGRCSAGALLGALPLYVPDGTPRLAVSATLALTASAMVLAALTWATRRRGIAWSLAGGAVGPPAGLLVLGAVFNNSPLEVRYLAFSLPWLTILLAGAMAGRAWTIAVAGAIQAAAIAGLLLHPATMQPARAAATAARSLPSGATVVVPRGNDGVGIVGAIALEVRSDIALLALGPDPVPLGSVLADRHCVAVAALAQDESSRRMLAWLAPALVEGGWAVRTDVGPLWASCQVRPP